MHILFSTLQQFERVHLLNPFFTQIGLFILQTCENFVPSKEKCCEYTCVSNSTTETSSDFNNLPNLRQKRSSNELSYVPDKNMFQLVELPKNLKEIIIFVKDKWKKIREFFKNLKK